MILTAAVIGIIENKIANDLGKSDEKVRDVLNEIKEEIKKYKGQEKEIKIVYKNNLKKVLKLNSFEIKDGFFIFCKDNYKKHINLDEIAYISEKVRSDENEI